LETECARRHWFDTVCIPHDKILYVYNAIQVAASETLAQVV
jgi:hypothetical protein